MSALCLAPTPNSCSLLASHHQVRNSLSPRANVMPMSSSQILRILLFHRLNRFGSLSLTLLKSRHSSSFVLWLCRTDIFHPGDMSSILFSCTCIILRLAELEHAWLDGGHLTVQIGSQGKWGAVLLFTNLCLCYLQAASRDLVFIFI